MVVPCPRTIRPGCRGGASASDLTYSQADDAIAGTQGNDSGGPRPQARPAYVSLTSLSERLVLPYLLTPRRAPYLNVNRISGKYPARSVDDDASRTRMRIVWPGLTLRSA